MELVKQYPASYGEFLQTGSVDDKVRNKFEAILVLFVSSLVIAAGVLTYSLLKAEK
jgi:hypothetical protein